MTESVEDDFELSSDYPGESLDGLPGVARLEEMEKNGLCSIEMLYAVYEQKAGSDAMKTLIMP